MLLGASNYTMQVLSSPTRLVIDKAHARRRWMVIGVLSIHEISQKEQKVDMARWKSALLDMTREIVATTELRARAEEIA